MNHNWYAVITAKVLMAKDISSTQKLLIALISNLSNERGYCFASNAYLGECLGLSAGTVSNSVSDLELKGYLGRIMCFKKGTSEIEGRFLTIIEKRDFDPPSIEKDGYLPTNSWKIITKYLITKIIERVPLPIF